MLNFVSENKTINQLKPKTRKGTEIMKTNIIKENINNLEFIELRDWMKNMLEDSMKAIDKHDAESQSWYKDCTMDEYFGSMWEEIWDDGIKVGEGLDTIAHKFVLNDDTRSDFEDAFGQALDAAYNSVIDDIAD
jgi:hypothetical protein